ncbi:MAG: thioredoxin domain-containing protein [Desulfobulbaceae bacterium]|nr:thioredoxin domain-containing protein [Desulfobulbaceae bacterium]HIJ78080.1 thioredoxin domain-containing protein [Deltaproteobacteria bacterium]
MYKVRDLSSPLITMLFFLALLASPAHAGMDWTTTANFQTEAAPLDIAVSIDGQLTYVLTTGGKLSIFDENGSLQETMDVDPGMDKIAVSGLQPAGIPPKVILANSKTNKIQVIAISFTVEINTKGAPFIGPEDAPVELVAFSDFECPYCSQVGALFDEVVTQYPDKIRIVFKQFPLSFHKKAQPAALASLAAHRQGKFWQYHDLLFANQKRFAAAKTIKDTEPIFIELAQSLELDVDKFNKDRKDPITKKVMDNDIIDGRKIGVRGTPAIFINGRKLQNRNLQELQRMVEQELAKLKKGSN